MNYNLPFFGWNKIPSLLTNKSQSPSVDKTKNSKIRDNTNRNNLGFNIPVKGNYTSTKKEVNNMYELYFRRFRDTESNIDSYNPNYYNENTVIELLTLTYTSDSKFIKKMCFTRLYFEK